MSDRLSSNDRGRLEYDGNELRNTSIVNANGQGDPPKNRQGTILGRSLGADSFNALHDGVETECVLVQGKLDERFPEHPVSGAGELSISCKRPGGRADGDMVSVVTIRHDGLLVPGVSSPPPPMFGIVHHGQKFATLFQADGNIVTYRYANGRVRFDAPVWASGFSEP